MKSGKWKRTSEPIRGGGWAYSRTDRGKTTFTMVIFVLLLISTGIMYYYFQKCRALERELTAWRTGARTADSVEQEDSSSEKPRNVIGLVSAMREKIMGTTDLPAPMENTDISKADEKAERPEERDTPISQAVTVPPPSTPAPSPSPVPPPTLTPATELPEPLPPAPLQTVLKPLDESLPAPAGEPDPFEEELPETTPTPRPTPRATATPAPTPRPTFTPSARPSSTPRPTPRTALASSSGDRQEVRRTPAPPRQTPRRTPARTPTGKINSMYDLVR